MGKYLDQYVKTEVLLSKAILENFRDFFIKTYKFYPAWYYTALGLDWDAMWKMSGVRFSIIKDYDMPLIIE